MIGRIKAGEDPEPPVVRAADTPTVADLAQRYLVEHVEVRCKPRTVASGRWLVQKFVLPELGKLAVDEVERKHIAALHYRHRATPYQANRILEVVHKMFNLAEAWGLRTDGGNPCRFVQKYQEKKREMQGWLLKHACWTPIMFVEILFCRPLVGGGPYGHRQVAIAFSGSV